MIGRNVGEYLWLQALAKWDIRDGGHPLLLKPPLPLGRDDGYCKSSGKDRVC